jgi:hypothetical protein
LFLKCTAFAFHHGQVNLQVGHNFVPRSWRGFLPVNKLFCVVVNVPILFVG